MELKLLEVEVKLKLKLKGNFEVKVTLKGFYMCFTDLSRSLVGWVVAIKHKV